MGAEYHGMNWEDVPDRDGRPYFAVANELPRHPKYVSLTPTAKNAIIELLSYCNTYLTDGEIPEAVLKKFGKKVVSQLIEVGWIETTKKPRVFMFHDYLKHQKSREQIEELRDGRKLGGRITAHKRWHVGKRQPDSECKHCIEEGLVG
jgi:hypothetical protein